LEKFRVTLNRFDGRLLATLSGLALVALVNLITAYQRRSIADGIAVAIIFLIVAWFAVRWFRSETANETGAPVDSAERDQSLYARGVTITAVLLALLIIVKMVQAFRHQAGASMILHSGFDLILVFVFLRCHVRFDKELVTLGVEPKLIARISFLESAIAAACLLLALMLVEF
jgi:hypothetical protein